MQILNTLTVLALVVVSFALIVAVPVLYASNEDSGRSNRLILLGSIAWWLWCCSPWALVSEVGCCWAARCSPVTTELLRSPV